MPEDVACHWDGDCVCVSYNQVGKQASKQASKQVSKQASRQPVKQTSA